MENIFRPHLEVDETDPPGFRAARARVGLGAGSRRLGASLYRLPPGEAICPYHWHAAEEEMAIVIAGTPSVRTPAGWRELVPGEVVSFPIGEAGAHQVANRSPEDADVLLVSEGRDVEVCFYPDADKVGIFGPRRALFRSDSEVDYWEGEAPPAP